MSGYCLPKEKKSQGDARSSSSRKDLDWDCYEPREVTLRCGGVHSKGGIRGNRRLPVLIKTGGARTSPATRRGRTEDAKKNGEVASLLLVSNNRRPPKKERTVDCEGESVGRGGRRGQDHIQIDGGRGLSQSLYSTD